MGTFTADASADETINVTVPTTTDELINNSGYITADQMTLLLGALNSRIDSLQTVVSSQNEEIASLSNTVDSLGASLDSLEAALDECGCGHQQNVCGVATVTDIDDNVYTTVSIGNQCWLKENLRTTRYSATVLPLKRVPVPIRSILLVTIPTASFLPWPLMDISIIGLP